MIELVVDVCLSAPHMFNLGLFPALAIFSPPLPFQIRFCSEAAPPNFSTFLIFGSFSEMGAASHTGGSQIPVALASLCCRQLLSCSSCARVFKPLKQRQPQPMTSGG